MNAVIDNEHCHNEHWTCPVCVANGYGELRYVKHLIRHWWDKVDRAQAANLQAGAAATSEWVCPFSFCGARCKSERGFRGHMYHEHMEDWMELWTQ